LLTEEDFAIIGIIIKPNGFFFGPGDGDGERDAKAEPINKKQVDKSWRKCENDGDT